MKRFTGRPIFICGWPRGGTRMMANLVASHPNIIPSSEVPLQIMLSILELMEVAVEIFEKKQNRAKVWTANRQDYFLNMIANTYGPEALRLAENRARFSNKTPSMETLYKEITSNCTTERPQFIYCVRHPKNILRSLKNMPWNNSPVENNLNRLDESAEMFAQMADDSSVSVQVVQVDKVGENKEDRLAFSNTLFDYLEEELTDEVKAHTVEWALAQPATQVLRGEKVRDLDEKELAALSKSDVYKALCDRFGYEA